MKRDGCDHLLYSSPLCLWLLLYNMRVVINYYVWCDQNQRGGQTWCLAIQPEHPPPAVRFPRMGWVWVGRDVGDIDMALPSGLRSFYSGHKPCCQNRKENNSNNSITFWHVITGDFLRRCVRYVHIARRSRGQASSFWRLQTIGGDVHVIIPRGGCEDVIRVLAMKGKLCGQNTHFPRDARGGLVICVTHHIIITLTNGNDFVGFVPLFSFLLLYINRGTVSYNASCRKCLC